jgi:phosphoribosylaminoimidazole-succinocarboxamide synthase
MGDVTLDGIDLDWPDRREGKVRVSYALPGRRRLFVTTDRLSAFDRVVAVIPHKGAVLNQLSAWWFDRSRSIIANHALSVPDPNCLVAVAATPLPVEVIVRGRITGVTSTSLWTRYEQGARLIDGYRLPDGLRKNEALPQPLVTPTTKAADGGHDEPLSVSEVVERGLVAADVWDATVAAALALFEFGQTVAENAKLVLADTKYEFGIDPQGNLLLIDEVHTPDSSRWWDALSLDERLSRGDEPESLDKEDTRRALLDAGYRGEGPPPDLGAAVIEATSARYVRSYERITGTPFPVPPPPTPERIRANLKEVLDAA